MSNSSSQTDRKGDHIAENVRGKGMDKGVPNNDPLGTGSTLVSTTKDLPQSNLPHFDPVTGKETSRGRRERRKAQKKRLQIKLDQLKNQVQRKKAEKEDLPSSERMTMQYAQSWDHMDQLLGPRDPGMFSPTPRTEQFKPRNSPTRNLTSHLITTHPSRSLSPTLLSPPDIERSSLPPRPKEYVGDWLEIPCLQKCPIPWCPSGDDILDVKPHVLCRHISGVFRGVGGDPPHNVLASLRLSALETQAFEVVGKPDLDALLQVVNNHRLRQVRVDQPAAKRAMAALCREGHFPVPEIFWIGPANSPASLMHWTVQVKILSLIGKMRSIQFMRMFNTDAEMDCPVFHQCPTVFDAHFHLDKAMGQGSFNPDQYVSGSLAVHPRVPVNVSGGVLSFCDPETWPRLQEEFGMQWCVAVGVHPTLASKLDELTFYEFQNLIEQPYVKAIGDIGLDWYGCSPSSRARQEKTLRLVLRLSCKHPHLPIIISVRGDDYIDGLETDKVHRRCIEIMRSVFAEFNQEQHGVQTSQRIQEQHGVQTSRRIQEQHGVQTSRRIHLHCFSGGILEANQWIEAFPNVAFGFSHGIAEKSKEAARVLLNHLPRGKIMLESDAPFSRPSWVPTISQGHPQYLGDVAQLVADLLGKSVIGVLLEGSRNAQRFYGVTLGDSRKSCVKSLLVQGVDFV